MNALDIARRRGVRLSLTESQTITEYERGTRLLTITEQPGWSDILAILKEEVERAQHKLIDAKQEAPNVVFQLHNRYHAMKDMLRVFESKVKTFTEGPGTSRQLSNSTTSTRLPTAPRVLPRP